MTAIYPVGSSHLSMMCGICQESYKTGEDVFQHSPSESNELNDGAKHPFHATCIQSYVEHWYKNTSIHHCPCPSCKTPLKIAEVFSENTEFFKEFVAKRELGWGKILRLTLTSLGKTVVPLGVATGIQLFAAYTCVISYPPEEVVQGRLMQGAFLGAVIGNSILFNFYQKA